MTKGKKSMLCLDLGTTLGWASHSSGATQSGTMSFKPKRFEGGGMRYLRFANWLAEVHKLNSFTSVYFEEVRRHMGVDAAHCYGGFMATLTAFCDERSIPYLGVPVGTIKKWATGKGTASKLDMINAAEQRGFKPSDDNEADALAILGWAQENG